LRNVRPGGHAAIAFTFGLPWTILAAAVAPSARIAAFYIAAYLVLRVAVYLTVGVGALRDSVVRRNWWLAPVRDAAIFCVWVASFFSNRISWRGLEFEVKKGLLIPLSKPQTDNAQFSIELDSAAAEAEKELEEVIAGSAESKPSSMDLAAREADVASFAWRKHAGMGED
jgi:hypothetical protein